MKYTEDVIKEFCQNNGLTFNGIVMKQGKNQNVRFADITCHCGHRYTMLPCNLIKNKLTCRRCTYIKLRKTSANDVQNVAIDRGYTYIKEFRLNKRRMVDLVCPVGHELTLRVDHFKNGHGCGHCKNNVKHEYEKVKTIIESEPGYTLISKHYINTSTAMHTLCPVNHIYNVSLSNWIKGDRCSHCSGENLSNAPTSVYYVRFDTKLGPIYKVGITSHKHVEWRFSREVVPFKVLMDSRYISREFALLEERRILNKYKRYRYTGEPLLSSGNTELFIKDVLKLDI